MDASLVVGGCAVLVALLGLLALHVFRGPNRQHDDLREELARMRSDMSDVERKQANLESAVHAIDKRLVGEHFTRGEIKEMLTEIRGQVGLLTTMVGDLNMAVALIRGGNVRHQ